MIIQIIMIVEAADKFIINIIMLHDVVYMPVWWL